MASSINKIWLDESGDGGFRFEQGSSKYFVASLIYLDNDVEEKIAEVQREVDQIRERFSLTVDYEFKFSRCRDLLKQEFLKELLKFPIKYKVIAVNKEKLEAPALKYKPKELYCETIRRLLYDNNPLLEKTILIVDEAVAKIHQNEFNSVLRKYLSRNTVSKIIQKRSRNEIMIQVADMVSGSVFRKYEKQDDRFYLMIKSKEKILMEF